MDQFEISHLDDNESQGVEVCDNKLFVEIGVVPVAGSKGYKVAKVDCPRLPFYGRKVADQVLHIEKENPEHLGKEVEERLIKFAEELELKVTPVYKINKDPQLTPKNDEVYEGGRYFNVFADFGSTNAKCLIAQCNERGDSCELDKIPKMIPTVGICAKWGIRYDKELAYTYKRDDFYEWLSSAVLTFIRRVQNDRKEYAVNVYWAFPKLVAGIDTSAKIDFDKVSEYVTVKLKEYGLRGRFKLMSEADALEAMFKNRVIHIAMASAQEVQTNAKEEREAISHNQEEDRKVLDRNLKIIAARGDYERRLRVYNNQGFFKRLFSSKPTEEYVSPYAARYVQVVKDRLHELAKFRNIGIAAEMPFSMLLLDAGGSTLDYCYIPEGTGSGSRVSGSYLAGGKRVTEILMQLFCIKEFVEAENRKFDLCDSSHSKLREATICVYDKCLRDLCLKIKGHGQYMCVVCTGLAMQNKCLRDLVRERLSLASDQAMIWSADIANMAIDAAATTEKFPDIVEFERIVRRLQPKGTPSPAYDVVGGLYFAFKEGDA